MARSRRLSSLPLLCPNDFKDLQKGLADTGLLVHQHDLHGRVIKLKTYLRPRHKSVMYAKQYLDKTEVFWKIVLWTNKINW